VRALKEAEEEFENYKIKAEFISIVK